MRRPLLPLIQSRSADWSTVSHRWNTNSLPSVERIHVKLCWLTAPQVFFYISNLLLQLLRKLKDVRSPLQSRPERLAKSLQLLAFGPDAAVDGVMVLINELDTLGSQLFSPHNVFLEVFHADLENKPTVYRQRIAGP